MQQLNFSISFFFLLTLISSSLCLSLYPDSTKAYVSSKQKSTHWLYNYTELDTTELRRAKEQIDQLNAKLLKEELEYGRLVAKREEEKSKGGLFWSFDITIVAKVDKIQLEVNEQERKIQRIVEELVLHWKEIKAVHGIFSTLCFTEVGFSFFNIFVDLLDLFLSSLTWGILSAIFFGPFALVAIAMIFRYEVYFLPLIYLFFELKWLWELPSVLMQYDPTISQFCCVYFSALMICYFVLSLLFPKRQSSQVLVVGERRHKRE